MSDVQKIAKSVIEAREPGMKPKDLLDAVRARHPKASKKEISRAAFYAVIMMAETDPDEAAHMQDFALSARGEEGEPLPARKKPPTKKVSRSTEPNAG